MSEHKEEQQEQLLNQKRKYPQVFKWKIAAIVIIVLLAICLVVNIIMFVYLKNHQLRDQNYSFTADIVKMLAGFNITRTQFVNLMRGLTLSYNDIWFQKAAKIGGWTSNDPPLTIDKTIQLFSSKTSDRFTLVRFTDGTNSYAVGAYSHIAFQVPDSWNDFFTGGENRSYYNFEIDEKESTLVGSNSQTYLKMDRDVPNLLSCKILSLSLTDFVLNAGVDLVLTSGSNTDKAYLTLPDLPQDKTACFSSNSVGGNYSSWLQAAVGPVTFNKKYTLIDIHSFSLSQ